MGRDPEGVGLGLQARCGSARHGQCFGCRVHRQTGPDRIRGGSSPPPSTSWTRGSTAACTGQRTAHGPVTTRDPARSTHLQARTRSVPHTESPSVPVIPTVVVAAVAVRRLSRHGWRDSGTRSSVDAPDRRVAATSNSVLDSPSWRWLRSERLRPGWQRRVGRALSFANGRSVTATVQNGWYFAWWPWTSYPDSVQVSTSAGTSTSPMTTTGRGIVERKASPACRAGTTGCVFTTTRAAAAPTSTVFQNRPYSGALSTPGDGRGVGLIDMHEASTTYRSCPLL